MLISCFLFPVSSPAIVDSDGLTEKETHRKWLGDYDGMVKERVIRALVPYSKTFYFLDGGQQQGLTYEALKHFEEFVNKREKTKNLKIHIIFIPTPRNRLLTDLRAGIGDIAAGNLTITATRSKEVDFGDPLVGNVSEIIVAGAKEPKLKTLFDLAGRDVYVRKSSSYYESLLKLNQGLKQMNKPPVEIVPVDDHLEDEDLLEMMNAGIIPIIVRQEKLKEVKKDIFEKHYR
jgi:membrane-bound lytic murein transglycosylase MltF